MICFFDIESGALRTRAWSLYDEKAIKYDEDWKLLCFAYKEPGKKVQFVRGKEKDVVKALHKVLDTYDTIIAHNAKKFDVRKANAKFFEYGLKPPSACQVIDTLTESRKFFALTSHRLNDLARLLGLEGKVKHSGFDLWEDCEKGDEKAWALMKKYNCQDVILLEKVYERLLPWIQRKNPVLNGKACPTCKKNLQKRGEVAREGKIFQRYYCLSCNENVYGKQIIERV